MNRRTITRRRRNPSGANAGTDWLGIVVWTVVGGVVLLNVAMIGLSLVAKAQGERSVPLLF